MNVKQCIKEAQLIRGYGLPLIVARINEIYNKHSAGQKLTNSEKLIIGLRYSEFLSDDGLGNYSSDDTDLYNASIKRDAILKELDIDFDELIVMCREQAGLH